MRQHAAAAKHFSKSVLVEERLMGNQSSNQRGGSRNFANDPEKAREAGRKGGQHSHHGTSDQSGDKSQRGGSESSGGEQRGGSGSFANDPEKASKAGRKGGEHSHGGK
jgi:uncharacterized protein